MAKKRTNLVLYAAAALVVVVVIGYLLTGNRPGGGTCPGNLYHCPGVGCVSGQDKCFPGSSGGAGAVFSKETFQQWPGPGVRATPPVYDVKESFVSKKCPDGTRSDGPCLMEFPGF